MCTLISIFVISARVVWQEVDDHIPSSRYHYCILSHCRFIDRKWRLWIRVPAWFSASLGIAVLFDTLSFITTLYIPAVSSDKIVFVEGVAVKMYWVQENLSIHRLLELLSCMWTHQRKNGVILGHSMPILQDKIEAIIVSFVQRKASYILILNQMLSKNHTLNTTIMIATLCICQRL